ncbi:hypothetical protein LQV05_006090 [Cryptococcus neoformans]|nr:hypothetical protein LQV05_006090 [Cryptococcus neoformans]
MVRTSGGEGSALTQTSPITQHSDAERRRILQILDDRVYRGHRQLRVVLSGDGPNGQWRNLDDLRIYDGFQTLYEEYMGDDELAFAYSPKARWISRDEALRYDGWKEAWEEFIGEDELHLDVLDVLDITAADLQLNTPY